MIVGTNMMNIYHHRLELIKALLQNGFQIVVAAPRGGEVKNLEQTGCCFTHIDVDNRGTNIKNDLKLICQLKRICKKEKPDVILTFYTKTNIYGGIVARALKIPYIENITGLGSSLAKGNGILYRVMATLYKYSVGKSHIVFFQNKSNLKFFHDRKLYSGRYALLPGSGVSLQRYQLIEYPVTKTTDFLFISRILREKGIEEYISAAKRLHKKYNDIVFHVAGPCDPSCQDIIKRAEEEGVIKYHGKVYDLPELYSRIHCTVLPSYYPEGMANVLLESSASGRPVITTGLPGCGEAVDDGVTGFIVREKDSEDLASKMECFLQLDRNAREKMGKAARNKMEREFNREIVTNEYLKAISEILKKK